MRDLPTTDAEPVPGEIIAQGQAHQNCQPKYSRSSNNPGETTAIAEVHEVEDDQERFADGNGHSDEGVQSPQIDEGHPDGDKGEAEQRNENEEIDFFRNDML